MKTALFLSIACAAALLCGCRTNQGGQGGAMDETTVSSGTVYETEPEVAEPSLPYSPDFGPEMPPP